MDTQAAKFLLDEFEGLPGRISRPQTFMEIGGYPFLGRLIDPRLGREADRLGYRYHLLVAGVLYTALAQVSEVGAGHYAACGLIELLPRPPTPVRPPKGVQ